VASVDTVAYTVESVGVREVALSRVQCRGVAAQSAVFISVPQGVWRGNHEPLSVRSGLS
jgi:hypothetical protein